MSTISLNGTAVTYPGGTSGLVDIDLEIADGEFVALVGPSGSGKTTLLRTIAGFLAPTAGTVSIDSEVVAGGGVTVPPERRRLGMVFQQHALWPHKTVGRNVAYPLELARVGRADRMRRVAEVLKLVGLGGYDQRDPATLSGGQRQRVALARALVTSPRALLLDEALSALDEPLRDRLRLELRSLTKAAGLTVIHVTHDRTEALALADRVVILDEGRIQQIGSPESIVSRPASAFVARFMSDATLVNGAVGGLDMRSSEIGGSRADGGHAGGSRFRSGALALDVVHGGGAGTLAILPGDLKLDPAGEVSGIVTSSLFGRDSNDVVVRSDGVDYRCALRGPRPSVGEHVRLKILRSFFYPATAPRPTPATGVLQASEPIG